MMQRLSKEGGEFYLETHRPTQAKHLALMLVMLILGLWTMLPLMALFMELAYSGDISEIPIFASHMEPLPRYLILTGAILGPCLACVMVKRKLDEIQE